MIQPIPCLLPITPPNPLLKRPEWLSPPPSLHFLCSNQAITLSDVSFRDRFGNIWNVPRGFPHDGMSYPLFLRMLGWERFDVRTRRTATMHDFRYSMNDYLYGWGSYDSQRLADLGLLDGLRIEFPSRAWWSFVGVRIGGYHIYQHESYEYLMDRWLRAVASGKLDEYIKEVVG